MQILEQLISDKDLALALGFFDGVHKGHQKVITSAVEFAKQNSTKSAVVTFKDHPYCFFHGVCPKYITDNRIKLIEQLGVDYLYLLDFEQYYKFNAQEYLERVLINTFTPVSISTGFNHTFGSDRSGNSDFLSSSQKKYGYKYIKVPAQTINNKTISSTQIRKYLSDGKIECANEMLGYKFTINRKVIHGQELGRTLGYRTANQIYPSKIIQIPFGVYEVKTPYGKGLTNFGIRPTVSNQNDVVLETHIINFDKDIYDTDLEIKFVKKIRNEQKFASIEELKLQIQKDLQTISFS